MENKSKCNSERAKRLIDQYAHLSLSLSLLPNWSIHPCINWPEPQVAVGPNPAHVGWMKKPITVIMHSLSLSLSLSVSIIVSTLKVIDINRSNTSQWIQSTKPSAHRLSPLPLRARLTPFRWRRIWFRRPALRGIHSRPQPRWARA